jgi:hypothetical protein
VHVGRAKRVLDAGGRLYANQRETDETVDEYRDRVRAAIAEDPDRYYQRGLVVRLEAQLAEADAELWQLGQTLREAIGSAWRRATPTRASATAGRAPTSPSALARRAPTTSVHVRLTFPHPELSPQ